MAGWACLHAGDPLPEPTAGASGIAQDQLSPAPDQGVSVRWFVGQDQIIVNICHWSDSWSNVEENLFLVFEFATVLLFCMLNMFLVLVVEFATVVLFCFLVMVYVRSPLLSQCRSNCFLFQCLAFFPFVVCCSLVLLPFCL